MKIDIYQVDAFANAAFEGNPAAVCPLDSWLPEKLMQAIAAENNLSETAFFVATENGFALRWFTPTTEVDLCGHATLASAYVLFEELGYEGDEVRFDTKSGQLSVRRDGERLTMNFPAQSPEPFELPTQLVEAFGTTPEDCLKFADIIAVFPSEESVLNARPDMSLLAQLECRGVIITAQSDSYDFVARWFGPRTGQFVEELEKMGLLMDGEVSIQQTGVEKPFVYRGFKMVDEQKLRDMRGDELRKINQNGMLPLIYAHLLSLQLMRDLFARQVSAGKMPQVTEAPSVQI